MPTREAEPRFMSDFRRLSADQRAQFRAARLAFIAALTAWEESGFTGRPSFPKSLGIRHMQGSPNILELRWGLDGRCTWMFGTPKRPGRAHVVWRRIGSHEIYDDP